jgi:putative endonuclease
MDRRRTGQLWEHRARRYLHRQGLRVLQAGYRCRFGELDLVCADGSTLVVIEVRARGHGSFVTAAESVDATKQRKLVRATRHLLMTRPQWAAYPVRFDVLAIDIDAAGNPRIEWLRGAFDAG